MKMKQLILVVLAVVVVVVTAGPRERRQIPQDCQWFESCFDETLAVDLPVNEAEGAERTTRAAEPQQNQGQGQTLAPLDTYDKCNNGRGSCVPYYLCHDGDIVTDGAGLFDIRLGDLDPLASRSSSECSQFLDVCCNNPQTENPQPIAYQAHCGRRNANGVHARITGTGFQDNQAQFGEFPWMAAVLRKEKIHDKEVNLYICGGSLIHPSVVLTAAHCIGSWQASDLVVRLGEWDTQRTYELLKHQERKVRTVVVHPDYVPRALHNTYALLFLDTPADLTPNVDTVCLNTAYNYGNCWATGWGTDKYGQEGEYQNVLKKVELGVWNNKECENALRETRLGKFFKLDDSFVCAGGLPGQDTCKGDGGSPLVCPRGDGFYTQAGIVAWGIGCGEAGVPGVYANITHSRDWIIQTSNQVLEAMQVPVPAATYWN
ncbi:hypothetical protein Pmani_035177 [Petrolisthes manimaculis]|uniref:Peptidase S1 domain-containing protein n=1 Tax=Petrolisthes manimaculis TaxID=1843537 RepID=A0AAE1NMV0_9EUCA|nr:hypothetical protein Pmani_035177 [Petrolisthes manimaculis]